MTKRTTRDPGSLCDDARLSVTHAAGDSMTTGLQHTHNAVGANIFILGADSPYPTYMVCIGRVSGEPSEDTEHRWNQLAEQMWRMGIEPPEDEPFFTVVEDGVVWDHYTLRPIHDYSYDERPLHV